MGCTYCMPMANEPGGSVAISHARAALSPALLLRTPHSTYRPLFAHLLPHCVLYFFEEDLAEEGKKEEEAVGTRSRSSGVDRVRGSTIRPRREAKAARRVRLARGEANCARGSYPILSDAYMTVVIGFRRLKPHSICGRKMVRKFWRKKRPV